MTDVIFTCECGMTLKANAGGQAGPFVECPSCGSRVPVPAVGRSRVPPPARGPVGLPDDEPDLEPDPEPETDGDHGFGIIYLALVSALTLGAIAFFLVPALRGPTETASASRPTIESPGEPSTEKPPAAAPPKKARRYRVPEPEPEPETTAPLPVPVVDVPPTLVRPDVVPPARPAAPAPVEVTAPVTVVPPAVTLSPAEPRPTPPPAPVDRPRPGRPVVGSRSTPTPPPTSTPDPAEKLAAAQRLENSGMKAAAAAAYQAVIDEFPGTMQSGIAKNRMKYVKPSQATPKSSPAHGGITPRG